MSKNIIQGLCSSFHQLLSPELEDIAKRTEFIKRSRVISGLSFVQGLVFTWAKNPDATLEQLASAVAPKGSHISAQALQQRFTPQAADFLHNVLQRAAQIQYRSISLKSPLFSKFKALYFFDSSTILLPPELADTWTGCGGFQGGRAALKVHVGLEYRSGELIGPVLSNGKLHDRSCSLHKGPFPEGSLIINDLGYFSLGQFEKYQEDGLFWLSRLMGRVNLYDENKNKINLLELLDSEKGNAVDKSVFLGVKQVKARLMALRAPAPIAEERRRKLREKGKRGKTKVTKEKLALCDWVLFVTNVWDSELTVDSAFELYRTRWQIE